EAQDADSSTITVDGIRLPDISVFPETEREELEQIKAFARQAMGEGPEFVLDNIEFKGSLRPCLERCQEKDADISLLRGFLKGHVRRHQLGEGQTRLVRLATLCHIDHNGLLRYIPVDRTKYPKADPEGSACLGDSEYCRTLLSLLAVINHYALAHAHHGRVANQLKYSYDSRSLKGVVRRTLKPCLACLRGKAVKSLDYL
ncbi:hypothetical protein FOZ63_020506, partial [Perkinsus olseni]